MASAIELFDKLVRQNPYLPKLPRLRSALRSPYHRLIGVAKNGMAMTVGKAFAIRVPAKYVSREMETYEIESCVAMRDWLLAHPGGYFVDIGCAFGYMSAGALFTDPTASIIAIDSDIKNIAIAKRLCSLAPSADQRLKFIRALISSDDNATMTMDSLGKDTNDAIKEVAATTEDTNWTNENVINLDSTSTEIPRVSLDSIFCAELTASGRPCLIKCDVEGGEMIVLRGLAKIMELTKPTMMISVHPDYLKYFGASVDEVEKFLSEHRYAYRILAIDHEQHWLCTPLG
jgi:FkbM family methyltransferase